jgi:peptidase M23-like protein
MRRVWIVATVAALALASAGAASAYSWPFKPFNKQHPIRGFFGDPRTVFENGVLSGGFDGPGFFSFHQGVDISAPNGTPVYPVMSGTAHYLGAATLNVAVGNVQGNDVTFQYFHITPIVGEGQQVVARKTVLGYVQPPYGHVHLTEIDGTRSVNPLQKGHLTPYVDKTRPVIRTTAFSNSAGAIQTPLGLCGRVQIAVDAFDRQPLAVPGTFNGLPVAPAFVQWTVTRLNGKVAVAPRTAADFRSTLPANTHFYDVYAKGTYENSPRFGNQQYTSMPGRYLFLLAGNFDTTSLSNGVYTLTVRVADIRGNKATQTQRFSVLNARSGVCPGSLAAPPSTGPPPTEPAPGTGD